MNPEVQEALSSDIHQLGDVLGETIRRLAGQEAFNQVEEIRAATKNLRANPSVEEARRLRDRLGALELPELRTLIRAFSIYFDLINLAEPIGFSLYYMFKENVELTFYVLSPLPILAIRHRM